MAVARGTVDERRALADNAASYLLGLDKDYKPKGVYVDDPKGMFILRWYKEVDKNGKELTGHQNPECVAYKLTLNNDGEPFRWTSNVQLISKVYLKKHTSQGRTYREKEGCQDGEGFHERQGVSLVAVGQWFDSGLTLVRQSDRSPTVGN